MRSIGVHLREEDMTTGMRISHCTYKAEKQKQQAGCIRREPVGHEGNVPTVSLHAPLCQQEEEDVHKAGVRVDRAAATPCELMSDVYCI